MEYSIRDDHLVIQKHIESQKGRRWRRNISKYLDEGFEGQDHHYHSSLPRKSTVGKVIPSPDLTRPLQDIDLGEVLPGSKEDDGRPLQAVNDKRKGCGSERRSQPESLKDQVQQLRLQLDEARNRNADLEAQLLLRPNLGVVVDLRELVNHGPKLSNVDRCDCMCMSENSATEVAPFPPKAAAAATMQGTDVQQMKSPH